MKIEDILELAEQVTCPIDMVIPPVKNAVMLRTHPLASPAGTEPGAVETRIYNEDSIVHIINHANWRQRRCPLTNAAFTGPLGVPLVPPVDTQHAGRGMAIAMVAAEEEILAVGIANPPVPVPPGFNPRAHAIAVARDMVAGPGDPDCVDTVMDWCDDAINANVVAQARLDLALVRAEAVVAFPFVNAPVVTLGALAAPLAIDVMAPGAPPAPPVIAIHGVSIEAMDTFDLVVLQSLNVHQADLVAEKVALDAARAAAAAAAAHAAAVAAAAAAAAHAAAVAAAAAAAAHAAAVAAAAAAAAAAWAAGAPARAAAAALLAQQQAAAQARIAEQQRQAQLAAQRAAAQRALQAQQLAAQQQSAAAQAAYASPAAIDEALNYRQSL